MIYSRVRESKQVRKQARRRLLESLEERCLLASLGGEVFLDSNGDGQRGVEDRPAANIRVYLDANQNTRFDAAEITTTTNEAGAYRFNEVAAGDHQVRILPLDSSQSSPRAFYGTGFQATLSDGPTQLFEMTPAGEIFRIGSAESPSEPIEVVSGLVRTNRGDFIGIGADANQIVRVDGATGVEEVLSQPAVDLVDGLAYDPATDTVYALAEDDQFGFVQLHTIDVESGTLSAPIGDGIGGLPRVTDVTFDTVNDRIVGFADQNNQFFQIRTDGFASFLASAERPLNSRSLAFDGTSFLMFDEDVAGESTLVTVDPDSGLIGVGLEASQRIPAESLFHGKSGNVPHRVSVEENDQLMDLHFGLLTEAPAGFPQAEPDYLINELFLSGVLGDPNKDQYVELRGPEGGALPEDTYLVIIDEDNAQRGEIHGIFDLGGQSFGENGFLVLLPSESVYEVDPDSAVLRSTEEGFGLLGEGDLYSDSHDTTERIDSTLSANAYYLIRSPIAPQLGNDIDVNNDGRADEGGVKSNWTVLDSVSIQPANNAVSQGYGDIVLRQSGSASDEITVQEGAEVVLGPGFGYAGRHGDSTGSRADDWVFGSATPAAQDEDTGQTTLYEIASGVGNAVPIAFHGRDLDHLGESNFNGAVRGSLTLLPGLDESGLPQPPEPLPGLTVLADLNDNGQRDLISSLIDPDDAASGEGMNAVINNAFPGVTISTTNSTNGIQDVDVEAALESTESILLTNRIFSATDVNSFGNDRRLRFDFYRPVKSVSIEAIGGELGFQGVFGRLDAYNENDDLIGFVRTGILVGALRETITFTAPTENIAYAVAYSDDAFAGTPFGRFDNFSYEQSEATAVTDEEGNYQIHDLFEGEYGIRLLRNEAASELIGGAPQQVTVTENENHIVNFLLRPNSEPEFDEEFEFELPENSSDTSVGFVTARDIDGQELSYQLLDGQEFGFVINEDTGELRVGADANLNFEEQPEFELTVSVTDPFGAMTTTPVTVSLQDVNEAPIALTELLTIEEGTPNGAAIGQIEAADPDTAQEQTLSFEVLGGSGANVVTVHPESGLLTIFNSEAIDFETLPEMVLVVRVSDDFDPPASVIVEQTIRVADQNDAPTITTSSITVPEGSEGVVGELEVADPDVGQSHAFELVGGTGEQFFDVLRDGTVVVRENALIDFEDVNSYTLAVRAIDNGAPPLASVRSIDVLIEDVDEPPVISPDEVELPENTPAGTLVTTLAAVDPEGVGNDYLVQLVAFGDVDNFDFDQTTGALTVAEGATLDFETDPLQTVRFEIRDLTGNDPTVTRDLNIVLTNQNDVPTLATHRVIVSELAQPGSRVGRLELQVNEQDVLDNVTTEIIGGNAAGLFDLDSQTRILTVAAGATFDADVESDPLILLVQVSDGVGTTEGEIVVELNDVNEPPMFNAELPNFGPLSSGDTLDLVLPEGFVTDPEGREFSVAIFGPDGGLPDWLRFDEEAGQLRGLATPSIVGSYPLTLRAFEPGPLELFSDIDFTVVVETGDAPLTNQRNPLDVDANQEVAALDALRVINFISRFGTGVSVFGVLDPFFGFVDTSGDGTVTSLDALRVINGIGVTSASGEFLALGDVDKDDTNDLALRQLLAESSLF